MKKELKDYLHLYLGCDFISDYGKGKIVGIDNTNDAPVYGKIYSKAIAVMDFKVSEIKPILRPLTDITEEEIIDCSLLFDNQFKIGQYGKYRWQAILFPSMYSYLLSKHFDLFGLIEAGLAIDKTTLK